MQQPARTSNTLPSWKFTQEEVLFYAERLRDHFPGVERASVVTCPESEGHLFYTRMTSLRYNSEDDLIKSAPTPTITHCDPADQLQLFKLLLMDDISGVSDAEKDRAELTIRTTLNNLRDAKILNNAAFQALDTESVKAVFKAAHINLNDLPAHLGDDLEAKTAKLFEIFKSLLAGWNFLSWLNANRLALHYILYAWSPKEDEKTLDNVRGMIPQKETIIPQAVKLLFNHGISSAERRALYDRLLILVQSASHPLESEEVKEREKILSELREYQKNQNSHKIARFLLTLLSPANITQAILSPIVGGLKKLRNQARIDWAKKSGLAKGLAGLGYAVLSLVMVPFWFVKKALDPLANGYMDAMKYAFFPALPGEPRAVWKRGLVAIGAFGILALSTLSIVAPIIPALSGAATGVGVVGSFLMSHAPAPVATGLMWAARVLIPGLILSIASAFSKPIAKGITFFKAKIKEEKAAHHPPRTVWRKSFDRPDGLESRHSQTDSSQPVQPTGTGIIQTAEPASVPAYTVNPALWSNPALWKTESKTVLSPPLVPPVSENVV